MKFIIVRLVLSFFDTDTGWKLEWNFFSSWNAGTWPTLSRTDTSSSHQETLSIIRSKPSLLHSWTLYSCIFISHMWRAYQCFQLLEHSLQTGSWKVSSWRNNVLSLSSLIQYFLNWNTRHCRTIILHFVIPDFLKVPIDLYQAAITSSKYVENVQETVIQTSKKAFITDWKSGGMSKGYRLGPQWSNLEIFLV